jgi:mannose-6-phosphate isomerase-like protein (cupin superfamily)
MLKKTLSTLTPTRAADDSELREILHPDRGNVRIRYSLAHAVVKPGRATLPHRLASSEVYYVIAGAGVMHVDAEAEAVRAGDTVYIAPRAVQWIENKGATDLVFLCLVDPAWRAEHEETVG